MNLQEIEKRCEKLPWSGCWIWLGATITGYGYRSIGYGKKLIHRESYETVKGSIPPGLYVCHSCDIKCCVNPAHLFLGTAKDNSTDAIRKKRWARAESHGNALLTNEQVLEIRRREISETQASLARAFGVSRWVIYSICRGRNWKSI